MRQSAIEEIEGIHSDVDRCYVEARPWEVVPSALKRSGRQAVKTMATTAPMRDPTKPTLRNLFGIPWVRNLTVSLVILAIVRAFTYIPAPVNNSVSMTVDSGVLSLASQWAPPPTVSVGGLSTISVSVGAPTTSDAQDLPSLTPLNDAIAGHAECQVALRNLIGIGLANFTLSTGFVIDSQGVTLANPRAYPGGGVLYAVTTSEESFGSASQYPAAQSASITTRMDVALGSTSGANLANFSLYVTLEITSAHEITCALDTGNSDARPSSRGMSSSIPNYLRAGAVGWMREMRVGRTASSTDSSNLPSVMRLSSECAGRKSSM